MTIATALKIVTRRRFTESHLRGLLKTDREHLVRLMETAEWADNPFRTQEHKLDAGRREELAAILDYESDGRK